MDTHNSGKTHSGSSLAIGLAVIMIACLILGMLEAIQS